MTVPISVSEATWDEEGSAGPYTFNFKFTENADIDVYRVLAGAETLLVEDVDYTLTGAWDDDGGSITLLDPQDEGGTLVARRNVSDEQNTSFINQGAFYPVLHEKQFDRVAMCLQDHDRRVDAIEALVPALENLLDSTIQTLPGVETIVHGDATAADYILNVVAANDASAGPVLVGKIDGTTNAVVFTPASGTVMGDASYPIGAQNEYKRFIPRASDNMWIVT